MAATGRLNGKLVSVTWRMADAIAKQYRQVRWQAERDSIVARDCTTASGASGYLSIVQSVIQQQVGENVYWDLTKLMVLPRPHGTRPAFRSISLIEQSDRLLKKLHNIVEVVPAEQLTVQHLACELNTSERTLARKIKSTAGVSVSAYARRIKLNQVSERLILTKAPASTISAELGFRSDSAMRRMFRELTKLSPNEYRRIYARG